MKNEDLQTYLDFAKDLAIEAGEIMKRYYGQSVLVEMKTGNSPVTVADKEINKLVIEKIKENFPDHGILGEEESWHPERSNLWVCDPIDGTVSFLLHTPIFMFSLAYVVDGETKVAVAYNPMTNELFYAAESSGAWLGAHKLQVSSRVWSRGTRLIRKGSPAELNILDQHELATRLYAEGIGLFSSQAAVFAGVLIASGSADGYIFEGKDAHDVAAVKLIVKEAGGIVTDLEGNEQRYDQKINGAIVSNGRIHGELLKIVQGAKVTL